MPVGRFASCRNLRWYRAIVLTVEETGRTHVGRAVRRLLTLAAIVAATTLVAGCGGQTQAADAPSGTWQVAVEEWEFPRHQYLGTPVDLTLRVRNTDTRTIPALIATVDGLRTRVFQPGAASEVRPIWMTSEVDWAHVTPYNSSLGESANLGELKPGDVATYVVQLTPLREGLHEVGYRLAPALFGDNKIVNGNDGETAEETRRVLIDPTPQFDESFYKN